ncbi:hypothetical protein ABC337_15280 [Arthrobacter sp. 1P04PC]|uniref:hypothetical protein n=1 Tax=unclassified Arthrobacter TaxID=235627 RepID=UPI0039A0C5D1
MTDRTVNYDALIARERIEPDAEPDGAAYARAILCRRKRKCIAAGEHTEGGCARCGL